MPEQLIANPQVIREKLHQNRVEFRAAPAGTEKHRGVLTEPRLAGKRERNLHTGEKKVDTTQPKLGETKKTSDSQPKLTDKLSGSAAEKQQSRAQSPVNEQPSANRPPEAQPKTQERPKPSTPKPESPPPTHDQTQSKKSEQAPQRSSYSGNIDASDPYQRLGVSPDASPEDIQKAFRVAARAFHPDVNPNNPQAKEYFQRINAAYGILSNPAERARFDRQNGRQRGYQTAYSNRPQQETGARPRPADESSSRKTQEQPRAQQTSEQANTQQTHSGSESTTSQARAQDRQHQSQAEFGQQSRPSNESSRPEQTKPEQHTAAPERPRQFTAEEMIVDQLRNLRVHRAKERRNFQRLAEATVLGTMVGFEVTNRLVQSPNIAEFMRVLQYLQDRRGMTSIELPGSTALVNIGEMMKMNEMLTNNFSRVDQWKDFMAFLGNDKIKQLFTEDLQRRQEAYLRLRKDPEDVSEIPQLRQAVDSLTHSGLESIRDTDESGQTQVADLDELRETLRFFDHRFASLQSPPSVHREILRAPKLYDLDLKLYYLVRETNWDEKTKRDNPVPPEIKARYDKYLQKRQA